MRIKRFHEAISGTAMPHRAFGPNYGEHKIPTSVSTQDTHVILAYDGNLYTETEFFEEIYPEYLKRRPGSPLDGFSRENLDLAIQAISEG